MPRDARTQKSHDKAFFPAARQKPDAAFSGTEQIVTPIDLRSARATNKPCVAAKDAGRRDPCRPDQSDAAGSYRRRDRSRLTRRATVRLSGDRSVAATRLHRCAASHLDLVVGPVRDVRVNAADARLWHPWLRIKRALRVMLQTRWSAETRSQVRVEFQRALALRSEIRRAGWFN
jgi:hypothetical protein